MSLRSVDCLARLARALCAAPVAAILILVARPAAAQGDIPLPPPPPAGVESAPATAALQGAVAPENCASCHVAVTAKRNVHPALRKNACTGCHRAQAGERGKCRSASSSKWALVRTEPELCYGCHNKRLDQSKSVHTAVRQGSCLSCHESHSSDVPKLLKTTREKLCFECHEIEPLLAKPVRHAPVAEGRCLDCHDPHGSDQPNSIIGSGVGYCQRCHDPKAPAGRGAAGPNFRIDLGKKTVHKVITQKNDCGVCHEIGHSGDNLKLLKKNGVDQCNGCHERQDKAKFPHTAVVAGDCAVCHDPHSSDQPKLVAKASNAELCFRCHQDDLTGRRVVHKPIEKGCDQCHLAHGGPNRNLIKGGSGKAGCYVCHQTPVDSGKVKHAALERYGCGGCHDPHGTANRFLLTQKTNALCIGCHPAQPDGKHVSNLVPRGHLVGGDRGERRDPRKPDRPFSCASCHNPHGSDHPNFFYMGDTALESCDICHGDKSGQHPELKNIISRSRPIEPSGAAGGGSGGAGAGGSGGAGGAGSGGSGGSGGEVPPQGLDAPAAPIR